MIKTENLSYSSIHYLELHLTFRHLYVWKQLKPHYEHVETIEGKHLI